jgi:rhomboid protease GluP
MFGHWRFLLLYLVAGFGGSCVGVWFQNACAGASGAICGLLGAFATWTFLNRHFLPPPLVRSWMRNVMINTALLVLISVMPQISWSGHLGGAIFGILVAGLLNYQMAGRGWLRWLALAGVVVLPFVSYQLLFWFTKREYRLQYYAIKVVEVQDSASKLFNEDLLPLWQSKSRRKGISPAQAQEVLSRIDRVLRELKQTADTLKEGETAVPVTMLGRIETFKFYVQAWISLLAKFQTVIRKGNPWSTEDEKELGKYYQAVGPRRSKP